MTTTGGCINAFKLSSANIVRVNTDWTFAVWVLSINQATTSMLNDLNGNLKPFMSATLDKLYLSSYYPLSTSATPVQLDIRRLGNPELNQTSLFP